MTYPVKDQVKNLTELKKSPLPLVLNMNLLELIVIFIFIRWIYNLNSG